MNRTLLFIGVLSLIVMQSCVFGDWEWNNGIAGNGNVISEEIDVDGFTGVHASSGIDVELTQGDFFVELIADENLHEYITIELRGNMLVVGTKRNIYRAKSRLVKVSLPELDELKISSAGDMDATSGFECEDLNIGISSAGDLEMEVRADYIDIDISSSGDCDIWGRTGTLKANLSSAGDLNAKDLEADFVKVRASSAGDASVWANKEIDMGVSSAGSIYYKGDAQITHKSKSSAGSIHHRN